jgi:rod shape-determining protein MreD
MNSYDSSVHSFQSAMRLCVPHVLTLFFVLLNVAAFSLPFSAMLKPDFVLAAVFYWAVFRPTLMPPAATFALGLLMDLLSGTPAGFYALTYVAVHWIIRDQRRFLMGQPYMTMWTGYAIVCVATGIMQWLLFAAIQFTIPDILPLLFKTAMGIVTFPVLVLLLLASHRILPGLGKAAYP